MSSALRTFYKASTLVELLHDFSHTLSEKVGVTVANDTVETYFTYSNLWKKAHLAGDLIALHTRPGDRVILAMPTSPEFIEYFFGCLVTGRIAVPLPVEKPTSRFSRINKVLADCKPTLAIFRSAAELEKMQANLGELKTLIAQEHVFDTGSVTSAGEIVLNPNQVALIQYTSGSTADPKGVVLTHANILANLRMIQQGMQITSEERVVSWLPVHHDMGLIGNLLSFVATGGHTYLYPYQEFARNPMSWIEAMSAQKATLSGAPTFAFDVIGKRSDPNPQAKPDLSHMRLLYCGSERILAPVIERFYTSLAKIGLKSSTFFPCYGMAEASLYISGAFTDALNIQHVNHGKLPYPICGTVANGLSIQVCNENSEPLPPGEVGEIQILGPSVSVGYWKQVAHFFTVNNYATAPTTWLKTGDLGCLVGNQVAITGRLKDVIKIRGRNVYSEDIEIVVEQLEDWVAANAVVAVPNLGGTDSSSAGLDSITLIMEVLRNRRTGPFEQLLAEIQVLLADHDIRCERLIIVTPGRLPKTSSGKKQRSKTAKSFLDGGLKVIWDSVNSAVAEVRPSAALRMVPAIEEIMNGINLDLADERRSFPADLLSQLRQAELLGLLIPKEMGGAGLTHAEFGEVGLALGAADLSLAGLVGNHNTIGVFPILKSTVLPDRAAVLEDIAKNGAVAAFAVTEPAAGSNPRAMQCSVRHVDGRLKISGEKIWIGNAQFAEYVSVFAKEYSPSGQELGISAFLLRRSKHKYVIGEEQLTVGLRAMPQNRLIFDKCEVAEADRLSTPGEGLRLAFTAMEYARFGLALVAVGTMKSGYQKALDFAKNREIWTGKLAENPYFIKQMNLTSVNISSLQAFVRQTAKHLDGANDLTQPISLTCKILAGEWASQATDKFVQFTGGRGYTETFGLARLWRDARVLRIFEGPTETLAFQLGALVLRQPDAVREALVHLAPKSARSESAIAVFELMADFKAKYASKLASESLNVLVGLYTANCLAYLTYLDEVSEIADEVKSVKSLIFLLGEKLRIDILEASVFPARALPKFAVAGSSSQRRELFDSWNGDVGHRVEMGETVKISMQSPAQNAAPVVDPGDSGLGDVRSSLQIWLKKHTRMVNIDNSISMSSYGVDSLLAYELLCFVEEELGVALSDSIVAKRPSIDELAVLIVSLRKENTKADAVMKNATKS